MQIQYEGMLILQPGLTEPEQEEIFKKITKKIEALEGKVLEAKIWAKERNLYHPIRSRGAEKKKFTKGCYWLIEFLLQPARLPDLKETIRLEEKILRNLILKEKKKKLETKN